MVTEKSDKSITVKLFISGAGTDKDREAAAEKLLKRCHPVVVGKEVFFLEGFNILG